MTTSAQTSTALAQSFVQFSLDCGVLKFGSFKTKAGRISPYFFNAGLFDDGAKLGHLAACYAQRLLDSGMVFDMIFGPAYKGIPLGAAVAVELARLGKTVPFAYNRKEAKDHGEGGSLVGAPLMGRVLIVDDVMSAGTAVRESIALIQAAGATPHAVVIALDRQEMATEVQAEKQLNLPGPVLRPCLAAFAKHRSFSDTALVPAAWSWIPRSRLVYPFPM